jgi:D-alanyl-lipoteichoic acid acyltransferase DltB (MBOAT superfamily)
MSTMLLIKVKFLSLVYILNTSLELLLNICQVIYCLEQSSKIFRKQTQETWYQYLSIFILFHTVCLGLNLLATEYNAARVHDVRRRSPSAEYCGLLIKLKTKTCVFPSSSKSYHQISAPDDRYRSMRKKTI